MVGIFVITPWLLVRFLSNHKRFALQWLLHVQSNFQVITLNGLSCGHDKISHWIFWILRITPLFFIQCVPNLGCKCTHHQPGKVHTELFRTECHSVACRIPGYKRDDIKLLPSSKSNKVSKTYSYKWLPSDQYFKQAVYVQILH